MSKKTVAIIIPTFNRAGFVAKAIDSSLAQTYPCEIIVCDHGSTDNTSEIVQKYSQQLKYIRRDEDFGPHFCWLEAVLSANAEYIHLQFDDDWIDKTFIEKTVKLMDDDVGMAFSGAHVVDLDNNKSTECFSMFRKRGFATGTYSNKILERRCLKKDLMISPGACLFRKRDLIDALYQGKLPLDAKNDGYHGVGPDFFMTLITILRYKKFGYVNEVLAFFGAHHGSITTDSTKSAAKTKQIKKAYDEVKEFYLMLKKEKRRKKFRNFLNIKGK